MHLLDMRAVFLQTREGALQPGVCRPAQVGGPPGKDHRLLLPGLPGGSGGQSGLQCGLWEVASQAVPSQRQLGLHLVAQLVKNLPAMWETWV